MKKIYFLYIKMSDWVEREIETLNMEYTVNDQTLHQNFVRSFFVSIYNVFWCDLLFCWFASVRFLPAIFLAKLIGKKVIIAAGGFDVVSMPEIDYGGLRKKGLITWLRKKALYLADVVVAVSESNREEICRNADVPEEKVVLIRQGFHVPSLENIPIEKEDIVVTIGEVKQNNLRRKGMIDFVEVAKLLPDIKFYLIGGWSDNSYQELQAIAPSNLTLTGFLKTDAFQDLVGKAKVVVQLSAHEAFGCSVAEGMLLKCVPVVSDRGSLPEVIGEAGFVAAYGNYAQAAQAIEEALRSSLGEKARQRIIDRFPLEKRRALLLNLVSSVLEK